MSHEDQGTGFDPGAAGHERQGRASKPKRRAPAPKAKTAADEFAGMTVRDCCADCNAKRCVITGSGFCGHPFKASHPGAEPAVQARIARAKKRLAHQKIDAA